MTATEVANKDHVKLALEADIDLLWIGAVLLLAPLLCGEIADALQGTIKFF
ncbi:MAG: hypothetical protein CM15mP59_1720 [Flavobacteriaceae bacterium]|nr:MAG: hypothetical protein CM15mP59_1720 [Flavobacteriaceae bacterium]